MGKVLNGIKTAHLSTARLNCTIEQWIFSKRDRLILKRKLLDGETYETIAEEFDMSVEQIKRIVKRGVTELKSHF